MLRTCGENEPTRRIDLVAHNQTVERIRAKFHHEGYVIIPNVFQPEELAELRSKVLLLKQSEGLPLWKIVRPWYLPSVLHAVLDPSVTIPDFMGRPAFAFMHYLPTVPLLLHALHVVFASRAFRYCSHNDIGIDRIVPWHKDYLNNKYRAYQTLPLWDNQTEGGHFIVKVLIYLQDHSRNNDALLLVPGSHMIDHDPAARASHRGAIRIHPKLGDIVIFDQRITHRGRKFMLRDTLHLRAPRILIALGFGATNVYTNEFEAGTRARQRASALKAP